jgi:putative CocE/NonD family hydrolase
MSMRVLLLIGVVCLAFAGMAHAQNKPVRYHFPRPAAVTRSFYLDGVAGERLAIDLYLPNAPAAKKHMTTLLISSRYGRRSEIYAHFSKEFLARGYAIVVFDTIGSGVSTGARETELGETEIAEFKPVARWILAQNWSDGQIALMGLSYSADIADLGTTLNLPAVKAAIIRFSESDPYRHLFYPGGIANATMRDLWGAAVATDDRSVSCIADAAACRPMEHVAPVDSDKDYSLARRALVDHLRNARLDIDLLGVSYADDPLPGRNFTFSSLGTASRAELVRQHAVPTQVWGSWVDAGTAASALERYAVSKSIPVEVRIAATSHGAYMGADPFKGLPQQPVPSVDRQVALLAGFLDHALGKASGKPQRGIHYAVLGSNVWRHTEAWPPAGIAPLRFYLSNRGGLSTAPTKQGSTLAYKVDFNATTGTTNRWRANVGVLPDYTRWPDDKAKVLRFISAPMTRDMEMAGRARIHLMMASTYGDGAVYAYLAVQRPGTKPTYVTEGMLRLLDRKAQIDTHGVLHRSFKRMGREPMIPGRMAEVVFDTLPVAAKLTKGDRLVVILTGADHDTFARYPHEGDPVWTLDTGGLGASFVDIPVRPWSRGAASETVTP